MEGTVSWFNNTKGYGFIRREDGPDVFIHYSGIVGDGYRTLQEGDRVTFEVVKGPKGLQAGNVIKLDRASQEPRGETSYQAVKPRIRQTIHANNESVRRR